MFAMLDGIVICCKKLQPLNAFSQMTFVLSFILYFSTFGALNNRFPSELYFAPNSSIMAVLRSSLVTFVEISSSTGFLGFPIASKRVETLARFLWVTAIVKRLTRVLMSTSCEGKTFFNKVHKERSR